MEIISIEINGYAFRSPENAINKSNEEKFKEIDPVDSQRNVENSEGNLIADKNMTKERPFCEKFRTFCHNSKEIAFILILCLSNVSNLTILNSPYMACGILLTFYFLNRNANSIACKNILVKLISVYNILCILGKIIFVIIYYSTTNTLSSGTKTKILLIDLGLIFISDGTTKMWINTFLCDVLVCLGIFFLGMYTYNAENYVLTNTYFLKTYKRNYQICVGLSIVLMTILSSLNLNAITLFYTGKLLYHIRNNKFVTDYMFI